MKRILENDEQSLQLNTSDMKLYFEQWFKKYGEQDMSFDEAREARTYLIYDNLFTGLERCILIDIGEKNTPFDNWIRVIDFEILGFKDQINPFEKKFKYKDYIIQKLENIKEKLKVLQPVPEEQANTNRERPKLQIKPIFNTDSIDTIFELLKGFFSIEQQAELKEILITGGDVNEQLIFLDSGIRLADAFKQLKKADIITGCQQKELEAWIQKNFNYWSRKVVKQYSSDYLSSIISTNWDKCQRPILTTKLDKETGKYLISKA